MADDNYYTNTARALFGQGLAMGWGDEIEAKLRSFSGDETYAQELAKINKEYDKYAEENSGLSFGLELAGGFLPTIAALLATPFTGGASTAGALANAGRMAGRYAPKLTRVMKNPVGRGTVVGGSSGAFAGAGSADEGERTTGALTGLGFGLGIGAGLPVAGRGAKIAYKYLKDRLSSSGAYVNDAALRKIYDAISVQGGTPEDVMRRYASDVEMDVPSSIADYNYATSGLANVVGSADPFGEAGSIIDSTIGQVKKDTKGRMTKQIEKAFSDRNYYAEEDKLLEKLRKGADKAYKKAYSYGVIDDPELLDILRNSKYAKAALKRGEDIAEAQRDAARLAGRPFEDMNVLDVEGGQMIDVRTVDYMKRGLDDLIRRGFDGKGALGGAEANAVKELKTAIIDRVDEIVPDYKTARKVYQGDKEVLDAMEEGIKDFNSIAPEKLARKLGEMSEGEIDAYIIGATRNLMNLITKPSQEANFAARIIGSTDMKNRLQVLYPNLGEEGLRLFENALLRESDMFKKQSEILGGSKTGKTRAGQENIQEDSGVVELGFSAMGIGGTSFMENIRMFLKKNAMSKPMMAKVADMLTESDPSKFAATIGLIEDYATRLKPKQKQLNVREGAEIVGGAQVMPTLEQGLSAPETTVETESEIGVDVTGDTEGEFTEEQQRMIKETPALFDAGLAQETVTTEVTEEDTNLTEKQKAFKKQFPTLWANGIRED